MHRITPRSGPPGRSAPTRAATTSRSSWTIRASPLRSMPTWSRTARASPSSGRAAASRTATEPNGREPRPGDRAGLSRRTLGNSRHSLRRPRERRGLFLHRLRPDAQAMSHLSPSLTRMHSAPLAEISSSFCVAIAIRRVDIGGNRAAASGIARISSAAGAAFYIEARPRLQRDCPGGRGSAGRP